MNRGARSRKSRAWVGALIIAFVAAAPFIVKWLTPEPHYYLTASEALATQSKDEVKVGGILVTEPRWSGGYLVMKMADTATSTASVTIRVPKRGFLAYGKRRLKGEVAIATGRVENRIVSARSVIVKE